MVRIEKYELTRWYYLGHREMGVFRYIQIKQIKKDPNYLDMN